MTLTLDNRIFVLYGVDSEYSLSIIEEACKMLNLTYISMQNASAAEFITRLTPLFGNKLILISSAHPFQIQLNENWNFQSIPIATLNQLVTWHHKVFFPHDFTEQISLFDFRFMNDFDEIVLFASNQKYRDAFGDKLTTLNLLHSLSSNDAILFEYPYEYIFYLSEVEWYLKFENPARKLLSVFPFIENSDVALKLPVSNRYRDLHLQLLKLGVNVISNAIRAEQMIFSSNAYVISNGISGVIGSAELLGKNWLLLYDGIHSYKQTSLLFNLYQNGKVVSPPFTFSKISTLSSNLERTKNTFEVGSSVNSWIEKLKKDTL